ncbi:MAG TPA: 50S ribosomal protein L2 [Planctomycetota bacterium]|nr:50S ribosomal protein L2 [Planctomycetota bacterium]
MPIVNYKPTSPGRRTMTVLRESDVAKRAPEKSLVVKLRTSSGRNNHGRITSRRRGGGASKMYRLVDFRRRHDGVPARVDAIEHDPYRSANIALLHYADGRKDYILAPLGLKAGDTVMSGADAEPRVGNCLPLSRMPLGSAMHCVESVPGQGARYGRAAGSSISLASREGDYATLIMPSGEMRKAHVDCRATYGQVGNVDHALESIGKAGRNRHKGIRPSVRGSAMSPYAHPLGGGEGRMGAGRTPCSPWGKSAKGGHTRNPRKTSGRLIVRKRKKK